MITDEQIEKLVIALKSHTQTSIQYNQDGTMPYIYEGRRTRRYPGNTVIPEDANDATYFWQNNYLVDMKQYHYDDKWYSAIDSVDYPYKSFGIIKVDDMPYRTFEYLMNKSSFIMRLDCMIYMGLCEPIMVFIDRKFVNWYNIDVVYDCGDTYLLLHGTDYTYQKLKDVKLNMVILPFSMDYIGTEDDDHWELNYNMLVDYLQSTLKLNDSNKICISVPDIDTVYDTGSAVYGVGAWMFTQLRMDYLGLLSEERTTKLKSITLVYREYDLSGNVIYTKITRFNALDKDSYDKTTYLNICHMGYDMYKERALFRFDDSDGTLNMDNGANILALMDDDLYTDYAAFNSTDIYYSQSDLDSMLYKNNYLTFKDGLFYPDLEYKQSVLNNIYISNPDSSKIELFSFANAMIESPIGVYSDFEKNYLNELIQKYIGSDEDNVYTEFLDKLMNWLDYEFTDSDLYDDNQLNGYNSILKYDPRLFNILYGTNTRSFTFTGEEANKNLVCTWDYESRRGLKIPRSKYKDHETYVMIYKNGELLNTYYKMIAFPNFFLIPIEEDSFNNSDVIELVYIVAINNNEIHFTLTQNMLDTCFKTIKNDSYNVTCDIFKEYIDPVNLKIFCDYPVEVLEYQSLIDKSDDIAFNISYLDEDTQTVYLYKELFDKIAYTDTGDINTDMNFTAVSERKFIYERLIVDQPSYRIKLSGRFRYCDNPKQYMLFINGRRIDNEGFLITIPKWTRPFWGMYLYTAKFVTADDRVELFYLPYETMDLNVDDNMFTLNESGYMEANRTSINVPFDQKLYEYFVNGKHIPASQLTNIDSFTIRLNTDTKTLRHVTVNNTYRDTLPEVIDYLHGNDLSAYDDVIDFVKKNLGYDELDNLFNIHIKITNTEENMVQWNTGPIAILNEIIRDFWVTSGYQYNDNTKFLYDYARDEYLVWDDKNEFIVLPSLSNDIGYGIKFAPYINIEKNYIHLLYFIYDPDNVLEIGSVLENVRLEWAYSLPIYSDNEGIIHQYINGEDIGIVARSYDDNTGYTSEITFTLTADTVSGSVQASVTYHFYNGIYYGNIDEDSLQWYKSGFDYYLDSMYHVEPNNKIIPTSGEQEEEHKTYEDVAKDNTITHDLEWFDDKLVSEEDPKDIGWDDDDDGPAYGYNDANVIEYYKPSSLYLMMPDLNKVLQDTVDLDLEDYIIGPNKYFVYAAPYRLCWQGSNMIVRFICPDILDLEAREANIDEHTDPLYTNGWWDEKGVLIRLTSFEMEYMGTFNYTNPSGYTERYCMWKSNGFFTRNYEDWGFRITVYDCTEPGETLQTVFSDDD